MSLADDLKPIAFEVLRQGVGAAIREFTDREPDVADKVKAAAELAKQAIDLLPEEQLHAHLSDEDAQTAIAVARIAKAIKLQGQ